MTLFLVFSFDTESSLQLFFKIALFYQNFAFILYSYLPHIWNCFRRERLSYLPLLLSNQEWPGGFHITS